MSVENKQTEVDLRADIVYQPKHEENEIEKFTKLVEEKHGVVLGDYWKLYEWSCKNYPQFWECIWQYFGIIHSQPYTQVFDRKRSFEDMEWFPGARLNYAENVFKHKDSEAAVIATDSADNTEYVTYRQLYEEVCQYTAALKNSGIRKGDVVGCYMSNKKEAIFAFLATASLGAIWSGALPLLGVKALVSRFQQISPKILFVSGDFVFEEKSIRMLEKLKEAVPELPTLEKVIFVPSKIPGVQENWQSIPKCILVTDFLEEARKDYQKKPWDLEYEQLPFDYPLCISFTSGTTGLPKGLIHSTGAFFASLKDYGLHQNITRKDVLINFSPVGWISWNMYVNTLHLGVTLCMYEGIPYSESPTRFWDLVDTLGITSCYIWSSTAEQMEKEGSLPTEEHSLSTLKQMFPMGSVMKPCTYDFIPRLKPGIFFGSVYGTTEVFGLICGLNSNLPVYRGEMQCFSLGMDVRCLDDRGTEIVGERGNLVLANPCPAMLVSFLNDNNKEKVRELYLSRFPGYWDVGDHMWINPVTKGFAIYGRGDETLNPRGARFSCSEIYFALENFPDLVDSVCVSQYNSQMDERVVLFVKMKPGIVVTEAVKDEIRAVIEKNMSYEHVPDVVLQVPDVPYNLTGKKLNILVKKLINKMPIQNADFVINPETVEYFNNIDLGDF